MESDQIPMEKNGMWYVVKIGFEQQLVDSMGIRAALEIMDFINRDPKDPSTFLGSVWDIIYYNLEG